jgi:glycosyltransferase involved in cell wall biosynthesis
MKIYFIGEYLDPDKQEAPLLVAAGLFDALRKKNIPVKYITYFTDGRKYSLFQKLFGKQIIDDYSIRFGILPMIFYIARERPDVLYLLNMEFFYLPLLLLKFVFRYKIFYTSHGIAAYENHYFRKLPPIFMLKNKVIEYLIFRISDNIISLSEKTARLISYCYKLNHAKIRVLNNGITPDNITNRTNPLFNLSNIKLAVVGSTDRREKGIGFLISTLVSSEYTIELNVFGENSDLLRTDRYNKLNVNLHPFVDKKELLCHLAENDIFIVPSSYDTFNLSLLEAMNLGMLFVSSDRVGLTERFDEKLMKFVYKHHSKEDLLNKLKMVINLSPEERSYYSELNHQFSLGFTWDKVASQYLELFND